MQLTIEDDPQCRRFRATDEIAKLLDESLYLELRGIDKQENRSPQPLDPMTPLRVACAMGERLTYTENPIRSYWAWLSAVIPQIILRRCGDEDRLVWTELESLAVEGQEIWPSAEDAKRGTAPMVSLGENLAFFEKQEGSSAKRISSLLRHIATPHFQSMRAFVYRMIEEMDGESLRHAHSLLLRVFQERKSSPSFDPFCLFGRILDSRTPNRPPLKFQNGSDASGSLILVREIGTNLSSCRMIHTRFVMCYLRGASFASADLRGAIFDNCDLNQCGFADADLRGCRLSANNWAGSFFRGARRNPADERISGWGLGKDGRLTPDAQ